MRPFQLFRRIVRGISVNRCRQHIIPRTNGIRRQLQFLGGRWDRIVNALNCNNVRNWLECTPEVPAGIPNNHLRNRSLGRSSLGRSSLGRISLGRISLGRISLQPIQWTYDSNIRPCQHVRIDHRRRYVAMTKQLLIEWSECPFHLAIDE